MRLTSGSELSQLNKDRLETCSLSFLVHDQRSKRRSTVDINGKSLEPQFSGGALTYVPWHFMHDRPLQLLVMRRAISLQHTEHNETSFRAIGTGLKIAARDWAKSIVRL